MSTKIKKVIAFIVITMLLSPGVDVFLNTSIVSMTADAHSGRTDSSGGHKDNKNKSGLGSYHFHCGGHPAHLHENGVCPYDTSSNSNSSTSGKSVSKSVVKSVQKALNELGYDCGKADGIMGSKTKKALKQYQKDNNLDVDGKIGEEVLESLGLD